MHTGGGGYNGGVAWVEVNDPASAMGTLTHEAIHVVMHDRFNDIARSAASCASGLDAETLNEGLDYAVSPGMLHEDNGDPLADARSRETPATNFYVRTRRLGLTIRPLLASALNSREKLDAFLPKACDAWRHVAAETWP